ncbi:hypothetical protein [Shinella pollutisoli]|uniref:Uncharacterized protein n=1 Tax=Shinella pollutisoli TaxID=2250594 RepID=A0ABV7DL70_9HYPH|nr:hypothetical protein [Shinella pollutisoli]
MTDTSDLKQRWRDADAEVDRLDEERHKLLEPTDPSYFAAIERFRKILFERLCFLRDHHGEPTGAKTDWGSDELYNLPRNLSADYDPDRELARAASEAGIPRQAFSWKSSVSFWDDTCVTARFGYAAPDLHHYPLSGGRWLICRLHGEDMPTIVAAVEAGTLGGLTVEPAPERF